MYDRDGELPRYRLVGRDSDGKRKQDRRSNEVRLDVEIAQFLQNRAINQVEVIDLRNESQVVKRVFRDGPLGVA